jgi:hypothetical protein
VELFNIFVSGRREEEVAPVSEGERSMQGSSWFLCGGATEGCNDAAMCGSGQQLELDFVWIDPRWKTISQPENLFGSDTVMEIKHVIKIEWVEKEILGLKENYEEEFGLLQFK